MWLSYAGSDDVPSSVLKEMVKVFEKKIKKAPCIRMFDTMHGAFITPHVIFRKLIGFRASEFS